MEKRRETHSIVRKSFGGWARVFSAAYAKALFLFLLFVFCIFRKSFVLMPANKLSQRDIETIFQANECFALHIYLERNSESVCERHEFEHMYVFEYFVIYSCGFYFCGFVMAWQAAILNQIDVLLLLLAHITMHTYVVAVVVGSFT